MSSAGTARKFALLDVIKSFWRADSDIDENDIKPIEKIDTKVVNVTEKDFEELKKSSKRISVLEDRYGIEPKNLKPRKAPKAKTAKMEMKNVNRNNEEREKADEERER